MGTGDEVRWTSKRKYIITDIMQGRTYLGAKEILESKLGYWQQIRAKAKNRLITEFLSDTTISNPYDSLIALYESETDLQSKYRLAFCYFNNDQMDEALGTLNDIPSTFTLDEYQTAIHQDYEDYLSILKMMHDSTRSAAQLDSLSVSTLFSIMDNHYPLISGYARGLLMQGHFITYDEKVYFPSGVKSYPVYHFIPQKANADKNEHLKIFPNPAWDYVIICFNTVEFDYPGKLIVSDINGKTVKMIQLNKCQNQLTVNLKDLSDGIYIINLYVRNKLVESKKLTKIVH